MKRYSLILFLCLIIGIMTSIKIFYKTTPTVPIGSGQLGGQATPTIILTPTVNQYPLQEKLPYQGKNFVVEKYTEPMVILIKTKRTDKEKIKEELVSWFTDNKTSTEGIQIDWQ